MVVASLQTWLHYVIYRLGLMKRTDPVDSRLVQLLCWAIERGLELVASHSTGDNGFELNCHSS